MGAQQPTQLSPDRWLCIQHALGIFRSVAEAISRDFPTSLEYRNSRSGSFPRIRILQPEAGALLLNRIAQQICGTGFAGFPITRQDDNVRDSVYTYITRMDLSDDEIECVEEAGVSGFWTDSTKDVLLLFRGLFAGGILAFAFGQKRWRVHYGLTSTRTPPTKLAVPYRAKDSASPR